MLKLLTARVRAFVDGNPHAVKYGIDGLLLMGAISIAANNHNIFALRLGAGAFQLSLLQFLPQIINLVLLIPAGLFADSLLNKRRMLSGSLLMAALFFVLGGLAAFIPVHTVYFFLGFIALGNVSTAMYNLSWQAYFPEVVEADKRNAVLTFRARITMIISICLPLVSGGILAAVPTHEGKILVHQIFYLLVGTLLVANAIFLRQIKATMPAEPRRVSLAQFKTAVNRMRRSKPFIGFVAVALFFHISWHLDWTLYFIGQANYLHMNEFLLGLTGVGATLAQLVTLAFWSKKNTRYGVEKPVTFGILGLALCPIAMILALSVPTRMGIPVFLVANFIGHMSFATIVLNFFQCLLKVVDKEYRSLSISLYTCVIMASNAVFPVAGVALYRLLGGDMPALRNTFWIIFFLRIAAAGAWWLRIYLRKGAEPDELLQSESPS
ncbi:MAG: MFS transporter [Defluviitaleaceae bacterium]|nr:MFS transporter [Defluviitaleaceae bacterium]MCL2240070.1 MFS transporter [Defluviitaleaceae bacterium]MCL2240285.1 MFS transporter [Defluviitaleaceae bacterium]